MPNTIIRIQSDDPAPVRVQGVVVEIYDAPLAGFVTSGTTDVNGEFLSSLPLGDYDVVFYKQGVTILPKQPQRISVLMPSISVTNTFLVTANVRSRPASIDPLRCRVSGYTFGAGGAPTKDIYLIFEPEVEIGVYASTVLAPQNTVRFGPDENGYFDFELLRNTNYRVYLRAIDTIIGMTPAKFPCQTPDAASVALDAFLFPIPVEVEFSAPTISLPLTTDWNSDVDAILSWSDGSSRTNPPPWASFKINSTDPEIVGPQIRDGKLYLQALKIGTTTLTVERVFIQGAVFSPAPPFISGSIVVTVA